MTELQEQYRLLEVSADVSLATLKQAYKDLVLVWHPDRFSDHPRLQKKAEEKLKCINLAYQEISATYRGQTSQSSHCESATSRQAQTSQKQPSSNQRTHRRKPPKDPFNNRHHSKKSRQEHSSRDRTSQRGQTCYGHPSGISVAQAQFVIQHFQFRTLHPSTGACQHFKSGPFTLDINLVENWLSLANLCDSINGFHPILLAIPCKASRLFVGREAEELTRLFKQSQPL